MLKKTLDFFFSLLLLILSLPLIIAFLLVIFLITKQIPIVFQERKLTLSSKSIKMIKLRTIRETGLIRESLNESGEILFRRDLRKYVPPFCKWLRKSGLDEITQLINVLKGEMSMVGPRPFTIADLRIINNKDLQIYNRRERIISKPGITGYWQVFGDRNLGLENVVSLDEYYDKNKSLILDLKLLFSTIVLIVTAKHSDSIVDSPPTTVQNKLRENILELEELWID